MLYAHVVIILKVMKQYFFKCSHHILHRHKLFNALLRFHPLHVKLLLYGSNEYDNASNNIIFMSVQTYIKDTKRFDKNTQAARCPFLASSVVSFCSCPPQTFHSYFLFCTYCKLKILYKCIFFPKILIITFNHHVFFIHSFKVTLINKLLRNDFPVNSFWEWPYM